MELSVPSLADQTCALSAYPWPWGPDAPPRAPAYAPELNLVEHVWNHSKYSDLANFIPHDIDHLRNELANSMREQRNHPHLLRSSIEYAEPEL